MPPAPSLRIHQPGDDDYEIEFARWKGLLGLELAEAKG
jgi:hypothetical protein